MKRKTSLFPLLLLGSVASMSSADMLDYYMAGILPSITKNSAIATPNIQTVIGSGNVWARDTIDNSVCYGFDSTNLIYSVASNTISGDATTVIPKTDSAGNTLYYINQIAYPYDLLGNNAITYYNNYAFTFTDITAQSVNAQWSNGAGTTLDLNWSRDDNCVDTIVPVGYVYNPCNFAGNCMETNVSTTQNANQYALKLNETIFSQPDFAQYAANMAYTITGALIQAAADPLGFLHSTVGDIFNLGQNSGPTLGDISAQLDGISTNISQLQTDMETLKTLHAQDNLINILNSFELLNAQIMVDIEPTFTNITGPTVNFGTLAQNSSTCNLMNNFYSKTVSSGIGNSAVSSQIGSAIATLLSGFNDPYNANTSILEALISARQDALASAWPSKGEVSSANISALLNDYNQNIQLYYARVLLYLEYFFKYEMTALYLGDSVYGCANASDFSYTPPTNVRDSDKSLRDTPLRNKLLRLAQSYDMTKKQLKNYINDKMISDPIGGHNSVLDPEVTTSWIPVLNAFPITHPSTPNKVLMPGHVGGKCSLYQYGGFNDFNASDYGPVNGAFLQGSYNGTTIANAYCLGSPDAPDTFKPSNILMLSWCNSNASTGSRLGQLTCAYASYNPLGTITTNTNINDGNAWNAFQENNTDWSPTGAWHSVLVSTATNSAFLSHWFTVPTISIEQLDWFSDDDWSAPYPVDNGLHPVQWIVGSSSNYDYTGAKSLEYSTGSEDKNYIVLYDFQNSYHDKLWFGIQENNWYSAFESKHYKRINAHCLKGSPSDVCHVINSTSGTNSGMLCLNNHVVLRPEYFYSSSTNRYEIEFNFFYDDAGTACAHAAFSTQLNEHRDVNTY